MQDIEKIREEAQIEGHKEAFAQVHEVLKDIYTLFNASPDEVEKILDANHYSRAKEQISSMQTITFGIQINVLLITDRLFGCAKGLQEYMQNSTDIGVDLVNSYSEAKAIIEHKPIDYLIIVGYLKYKVGYDTVKAARKINKYISVIMYASLDECIEYECHTYGITDKFHRREPMNRLIEYMRKCYGTENARFLNDYPYGMTKEKLRDAAIQDAMANELLREQEAIIKKKKEALNKTLGKIGMAALVILIILMAVLGYFYKQGMR